MSICSFGPLSLPITLTEPMAEPSAKRFYDQAAGLRKESLFETSVNAHYVFLKTSKRVFRKCAFRFSKRNHPRVTKERRGRTLQTQKVCVRSPRVKKFAPQEGTNSNFSKCMRQLPHASDKSFCDWIKILSFLLRVDQIPILDIIEF